MTESHRRDLLIRLKLKPPTIRHPEDVEYIRQLLIRAGYYADDETIQEAWEMFSDDFYCASWMSPHGVDLDLEISRLVERYFVPDDED